MVLIKKFWKDNRVCKILSLSNCNDLFLSERANGCSHHHRTLKNLRTSLCLPRLKVYESGDSRS